MMMAIIPVGTVIMTAIVNGKVIQMLLMQERILVGGARTMKTMRIGTIGGITVSTMIQTGTALTTSDKATTSSTLQTETSGQVQRMEKMDTTMVMITTNSQITYLR